MKPMTVKEASKLTGVTVRALQYYDKLGLLPPAARTEAGYRLYDDAALERLEQILLFRELEFPLKDIKAILDAPNYDRGQALERQIELLRLKKEHLEDLIDFARGLQLTGGTQMDFSAFDTKKLEDYAQETKALWGDTAPYREYEERSKTRTDAETQALGEGVMAFFTRFGELKGQDPAAPEVQAQVKALQDYITKHFYTCTKEILSGLGEMYAAGGKFTQNIDKAGGIGTARFAAEAIKIYNSR